MNNRSPFVLSATTLSGDDVRNPAGEDLGSIKDIMLDVRNGRVAYAVLDFGGFLGMGNKLFAVPFESMSIDTKDHCFILDIDKERLKNAPGFDKDNWPANADYSFIDGVRTYYGLEAYHRDHVGV